MPLFMLALGFELKDATVLSQCTIAAVSAASIVFNLPKRHPDDPQQTLIAYEMLLVLGPALLLGVGIGVILNVALPTWLITTMLISLLIYMSTRTMQKGLSQWRNETHSQQAAAAMSAAGGEEAAALLGDGNSSRNAEQSELGTGDVEVITQQPATAAAPKAPRAPYPWGMAGGVVLLWCGFGALQLLRQNTVKCSPAFFGVIAGQVRELCE